MKIFAIKNEKLNFFNRPIYVETANEALSYIQNILMSDSERALSGLKSDLALYEQGEIDFTTGIISPTLDVFDTPDGETVYTPRFVCSLEFIFDSIPKERLKPQLTKEDFINVCERVEKLEKDLLFCSEKVNNHRHHRKEIIK